MATEIFCWGYTAWRSQRRDSYEVSGYIDGYEFYAVKKTAEAAERAFCHAAFRGWTRRQFRSAVGLSPRHGRQADPADSYHPVSVWTVAGAFLHQFSKSLSRRLHR